MRGSLTVSVRSIVNLVPWLASCVIAGTALCSAVSAQPVPPSLTADPSVSLATAIDAAWQRAVSAREADGQRRRAHAEQAAAAGPWAAPPALGLSHRDDRLSSSNGSRETEVALSWPLWLPGQRRTRAVAADAEAALAETSAQVGRWRIAGEVREAAWTLVAYQAEASQADALVASLQGLADDVDRRVRAGELARADALAARAELMAASAQQAEAQQRLLSATTRWRVLTGLPVLPDPGEAPRSDAVPNVDRHPEVQHMTQTVELARLRLDRVNASRRDPPELSVRLINDTPARTERSSSSVGVALRLPFGTDDRNLPLQAAALSELEIAQAQEQRLRERLAADLTASRAAVASAQTQEAAERSRASLLRERAQLIDKSYRAGESPLPELLRAMAAAAQADASLARQQAASGLARARLHQVSGLVP
jgi:cobalt-zinc-cadmium efflux system outer membrane protein